MPVTRFDRADNEHLGLLPRAERRSPMHARLRGETAELHRALETELDLLETTLDLGRYVAVLRAFHGYYAALEPRLQALALSSPPSGFELCARTPLLERDLAVLGLAPAELTALAGVSALPALCRVEHLAGCLYVVEGAALELVDSYAP
jgi:heme oxygenase